MAPIQRIGRYEIVEEIGRGGFGRVYRANDPLMQCEVAIKVMSNADDPEMLARFRDEAAATRRLHHESIVTIYDVGEESGVPYIVMEYLKGTDLQKMRDQNVRMTLLEKVRILSQVAAGLQVAHENGILHRDVKPANIMVLKDGSVKIMDFGIARFTRDAATRRTRTGVVVGTLQYISPEQFEEHPVDSFTDLWAFGVIAYQLFSGRNPFDASDTVQVIRKITAFSVPNLRELNPELPEDLCQIVRKLLDRDRTARYQSFEDIRIDLNPILERLEGEEASRLLDDARVGAARGDLQGAHHILRQVLERYPSNTKAKNLRDQIVTQIRTNEVQRQIEELLRKGDQEFSAGNYEEALASYRQAQKLHPAGTTPRMKMEHARQMAERARKIRESILEARTRFAAGAASDARSILAAVLADEPSNADALSLMTEVQKEIIRHEDAARAEAILDARRLVAQQQYSSAMEVLNVCARKVGEHAEFDSAREEVRRAELTHAAEVRVDAGLAKANEHIQKGDYGEARRVLDLLAVEFPRNPDVKTLRRFATEEEARLRRRETQEILEKKATQPVRSVSDSPVAGMDRKAVIARVLEISLEHQRAGKIPDAVHVLDLAIERMPDAQELIAERERLLAPKPRSLKWEPEVKEWVPKSPPVAPPVPAPAPPPLVRPAPVQPAPVAPPQPSSKRLPMLLGAAAGLVCAGLVYWLATKPPRPSVVNPPAAPSLASLLAPLTLSYTRGEPLRERVVPVDRPALEASASPGSWLSAKADGGRLLLNLNPTPLAALETGKTYRQTVQVRSNGETAPLDVALTVYSPQSKPALATLLSPVSFSYRKGEPAADQTVEVDRPGLKVTVPDAASWLSATVNGDRVVLGLKPAPAAALAPGVYHQAAQVSSAGETARLDVALTVLASKPSLASILHPVSFSYRKGEPAADQMVEIDRPGLQVTVPDAASWLSATVNGDRLVLGLKPAPAAALAPGVYHQAAQVNSAGETARLDVALTVLASKPSLASLLHPVSFSYRKGDPASQQTVEVDRPGLRTAVPETAPWLSASAANGRIVLALKPEPAGALPPGVHHEAVQVTSEGETAPLEVALTVLPPKEEPKPPETGSCTNGPPPYKPYNGPKKGTTLWAGSLAPGATLVICDYGVLHGVGQLTEASDSIPPRDVQVEVRPNLQVKTPQAGMVVIVNSTSAPVPQIQIKWSIK